MPHFINDGVAHSLSTPTPVNSNCGFGSYVWFNGLSGPWKMQYCAEAPVGAIAGITELNPSYNGYQLAFKINLAAHGLSVGDVIHLAGITGCTRCNGSGLVVSVTDRDHVVITMVNGYTAPGFKPVTTNATLTKAVWKAVPYTAAKYPAGPQGSCTSGAWAADTTLNPSLIPLQGTWRCVGGAWTHWRVIYNPSNPDSSPSFDFATNPVRNVRLIGLWFTGIPFDSEPLQGRWSGGMIPQPGLVYASPQIYVGLNSSVVIDRCVNTYNRPAKQGNALVAYGPVAYINSFLYMRTGTGWCNPEDRGPAQDNYASASFLISSGSGILLRNNWLEAYGITVHFDDRFAYFIPPTDITVSRNMFYRDPKFFYGSPLSDGFYYPLRQLLEFKAGLRISIDGNRFFNNWHNVSQANAIFLWGLHTGNPGTFVNIDASGKVTGSSIPLTGMAEGDYVGIGNGSGIGYAVTVGVFQVHGPVTATGFSITDWTAPAGQYVVQWMSSHRTEPSDVSVTNNTFNNVPTGIVMVANQWATWALASPGSPGADQK